MKLENESYLKWLRTLPKFQFSVFFGLSWSYSFQGRALSLKIRNILYNNPIKHFCLKYKESYFYQ
jgi:hypothetical protein